MGLLDERLNEDGVVFAELMKADVSLVQATGVHRLNVPLELFLLVFKSAFLHKHVGGQVLEHFFSELSETLRVGTQMGFVIKNFSFQRS